MYKHMIPIVATVRKWRGKICLAFLFRVSLHTVIQQCIDVQVSLINFLYSSAVLTMKHLCNVVGLQIKLIRKGNSSANAT